MKPTVDEAQQLGQHIVNLVSEHCERIGVDDLNAVLNVLVSVLAHYIGGIEPLSVRQAAYTKVGAWLAQHLEELEAGGHTHAMVKVTKDGEQLQ